MHRYWMKIEGPGPPSFPGSREFGITAIDADDALGLLGELFGDLEYQVLEVIENVPIHDLDQRHVVPNMGSHFRRGIWWPALSRWSP